MRARSVVFDRSLGAQEASRAVLVWLGRRTECVWEIQLHPSIAGALGKGDTQLTDRVVRLGRLGGCRTLRSLCRGHGVGQLGKIHPRKEARAGDKHGSQREGHRWSEERAGVGGFR